VAAIAYRAYNLEGKMVGTIGAGRIRRLLLQRLKLFSCTLLYHNKLKMEKELENMTGKKFEEDLDLMLSKCDIVVINMPLIKKTRCDFQLILNIEVWTFCL
jgi:formate dehydrogenase